MTAYAPVLISKHITLSPNVVDTVTVERPRVEVKNRGTGEVYFRLDGKDPVPLADDTYVLLPGESLNMASGGPRSSVRLVSAAGGLCSVTGSGA